MDILNYIAPCYHYMLGLLLRSKKYMHYWLKGGRGSCKSSFVVLFIVWSMTRSALKGEVVHCVALRKVKDTIKDSIYTNFLWAIDLLGVGHLWVTKETPMKLQVGECTILFRGCANQRDYEKIKSIKFKKGFCKFAVFEELTEFAGIDEVLSINQSLFRGGNQATAFYMYNPPPSKNNWVNAESLKDVSNRYTHHSTYLDIPRHWLGEVFINDAETLKIINPRKYNHMYMGNVTGEGLEIYPEKDILTGEGLVTLRTITDDEIKTFYKIDRGIDFGFSHATAYGESFYDKNLMKLYIFGEVYGRQMSNQMIYSQVYPMALTKPIFGDNAEPRTINELNKLGLSIYKTKKGKDSKTNGIKWLQDRAEIIIDKKRCPNIATDFITYEFKKDPKTGEIIYEYPDEPDGSACIRYGNERNILNEKWGGLGA